MHKIVFTLDPGHKEYRLMEPPVGPWGELAMLWLYIAAAGVGTLLGLFWLRVLAVLAGSVMLVAISVVWMTLQQWPLLGAVINVFMLLATLQFSYLAMLMLSIAWTRLASRGLLGASTRRV